MRAALHPAASGRSLALQQYDEARTASPSSIAAAAAAPNSPNRTSARHASTPSGTPAAVGDDATSCTLCGWLEEPSVPPEARAASAKLRSALQHPLPVASSSSSAKCSSKDGKAPASRSGPPASSPRKQAATSPLRAWAARQQMASAAACRQQHHHQLGEEDSFEATGHFRPAAAADIQAAGADARPVHALHLPPVACPAADAGQCSSTNSGSSSRCATPQACAAAAASGLGCCNGDASPAGASSTPAAGADVASPHWQQCEPPTLPVLATPAELCSQQPLPADLCSQQPSLYSSSSNSTVGGIEPGLFGAGSRLRSSSSSVRVSSSNASIVALQQRLLLHSNSTGQLGSGCSLQSGRWAAQLMLPAGARTAGGVSGSPLHLGSLGPAADGGGTEAAGLRGAGALSLHNRMATTAARAQLLLTRDHLGCLAAPHAPRLHRNVPLPPAAATQPSNGGALVQPGADFGLHFGSRPGSASRRSSGGAGGPSGAADAGVRPCSAAPCELRPVSAVSSSLGAQRWSGSSSGSRRGGSGSSPVGGSSRPSSASVGSSSGGGGSSGAGAMDSGWRERPHTTSSQQQIRGLAAAAEYNACRATVSALLQRINSRGGCTVGPALAPPRCDTVRSRDRSQASVPSRVTSSSLQQQEEPPSLVCESRGLSLKAYKSFHASLAKR